MNKLHVYLGERSSTPARLFDTFHRVRIVRHKRLAFTLVEICDSFGEVCYAPCYCRLQCCLPNCCSIEVLIIDLLGSSSRQAKGRDALLLVQLRFNLFICELIDHGKDFWSSSFSSLSFDSSSNDSFIISKSLMKKEVLGRRFFSIDKSLISYKFDISSLLPMLLDIFCASGAFVPAVR